MNCRDAQEKLVELLYGELPEQARPNIEEHVAHCRQCRAEWEALQQAHAALGHVPPIEEPALGATRVLAASSRQAEKSRRRWQRIAAAASLATVFLLGIAVLGLRVETRNGAVLIGWGNSDATVLPKKQSDSENSPEEPPVGKKRQAPAARLALPPEQQRRLADVEELARMAAEEVMAVDRRASSKLAQVQEQLARLRRLEDHVAALRRENDRRWQLLAEELLRQDAQVARFSRVEHEP